MGTRKPLFSGAPHAKTLLMYTKSFLGTWKFIHEHESSLFYRAMYSFLIVLTSAMKNINLMSIYLKVNISYVNLSRHMKITWKFIRGAFPNLSCIVFFMSIKTSYVNLSALVRTKIGPLLFFFFVYFTSLSFYLDCYHENRKIFFLTFIHEHENYRHMKIHSWCLPYLSFIVFFLLYWLVLW